MKTFTFKIGGVHPNPSKLSANIAITDAKLPQKAYIPLAQHIGKPAIPIVSVGDTVLVGQLIAQADGFVSANVHSPFSGKVAKFEEVNDASGYKKQAIVIDVEGDEWIDTIDRSDIIEPSCPFTPEEIKKRIQEAGIVGMGGATFPSHVKLAVPEGKKAEVLIINAAECEPYLTCDHRLMLEKSEEIICGVHILKKALNVDVAYIGIEANKPDAIKKLTTLSHKYLGVNVIALKEKYPQGGEKQLIEAITGRRIPSGKLPIEVGAVVMNIASTFAVYEAVQKNKPLIERIVTITGKNENNLANIRVRIGTLLSEVIEQNGGIPAKTGKIIVGGPLMGKAVAQLDIPVSKGTSGVLFMTEEDAVRHPETECIRCGRCVTACPMGLEPYLMANYSTRAMWDKLENEDIADCIECGCCQSSCPSYRPLLDFVRMGKRKVMEIKRNRVQK